MGHLLYEGTNEQERGFATHQNLGAQHAGISTGVGRIVPSRQSADSVDLLDGSNRFHSLPVREWSEIRFGQMIRGGIPMVEVAELIGALERILNDLNVNKNQLADRIPVGAKSVDEETFLLSKCSELESCSRLLFGVIESLKDYNSRRNIPIPH